MGTDQGVIVSINVSRGGLPKRPVREARVSPTGLEGDGQRNLRVHGGPDRALCLYAAERIEALQGEGHPIAPGTTGENLTVRGLAWDRVVPGAILALGEVTLEITSFATPCGSIRPSFADGDSMRVSQDAHPGWSRVYARVTGAGVVRVGDAILLRGSIPSGAN